MTTEQLDRLIAAVERVAIALEEKKRPEHTRTTGADELRQFQLRHGRKQ